MQYILNRDGSRNRDFRPASQLNEWVAPTVLFNPHNYQPLGFYERQQPQPVTWMDVWRSSTHRAPAAVFDSNGNQLYPTRINNCGVPVKTKYEPLYSKSRQL